jgi:Beta/Gamma crystallin
MRKTTITLATIIGSVLATSAIAQDQAQDKAQDRMKQERMSQQTDSAKQTSQSKERSGSAAVVPFVTVLVPVAMETKADTSLANGCWAKLYGQKGMKGDSLTLVGPVDMADMTGPFGIEWDDKVSSLQAGPNATLQIYDSENFKERATTVKSGEQIREIGAKQGAFEDVESIRVSCNSGSSSQASASQGSSSQGSPNQGAASQE